MYYSPNESRLSDTVIRQLFPGAEPQSINALAAIWDEVVCRIIDEMMMLQKANQTTLHINVYGGMVLDLARLQLSMAKQVVENRTTGRDLPSIDPRQEREECLGSEGAETISATARRIYEHVWSKRLEERWKPKSVRAFECEANPKRVKLPVRQVNKNHFIPRWFIRDHWATDGKVLQWQRTGNGWTSSERGFSQWGYGNKLYSNWLEAYFSLLDGDAKGPIQMLLKTHPLNPPQREALIGFLVIQILRNPYFIAVLQQRLAPEIAELGHVDDAEMPRSTYESLYRNNQFYDRIASSLMWSPWAIIRSECPVFVLPDTFAVRAGARDGTHLIVPLTPTVCFATLPGHEQQKRVIPYDVCAGENLSRRIALMLEQAAAAEFLSHPDFSPVEGDIESPNDVVSDIARAAGATTENEDIS